MGKAKSKPSKVDLWTQGYMCALATIMKQHAEESIVYDAFVCNPMTEQQMIDAGVDEFDIEALKPVIKEHLRKKSIGIA